MILLYPLIGLYLLLMAYVVLGGWPSSGNRQQVRLVWLFGLPVATFVVLWLSGSRTWGLVLWLWQGERYLRLAGWYAGLFALAVAAILYIRLATGRASRRYVLINVWGAGLCVAFLGAMRFIHFAEGIDGWTARGAAENQFAYLMEGSEFYPAHLPRRIVDETTPQLAARGGKAYAIYVGDERASELRVMPYYRWWWSVGYSRKFAFGAGDLSIQEQVQRLHETLQKERR